MDTLGWWLALAALAIVVGLAARRARARRQDPAAAGRAAREPVHDTELDTDGAAATEVDAQAAAAAVAAHAAEVAERASSAARARQAEEEARARAEAQQAEEQAALLAAYEQAAADAERREARLRADEQARDQAERAARQAAELAAHEEAERLTREEAARAARAESERAARAEAERAARAEAERSAREQAERHAARREEERAAEALAAAQAAEREAAAEAAAHESAARAAAQAAAAEAAARAAAATQAAQADVERDRAARLAPEPAPRTPAQTLVLVADDSKVVRVKTSRVLVRHGYRFALAEDGQQALSMIDAELPQIVITDVEMPGVDGFELTRRLRADPRTADVPIVMITAADDRLRSAAAEAGVTVVLGKPYDDDTLVAHLEALAGVRATAADPA